MKIPNCNESCQQHWRVYLRGRDINNANHGLLLGAYGFFFVVCLHVCMHVCVSCYRYANRGFTLLQDIEKHSLFRSQ